MAEMMSGRQTAEYLGVSPSTVRVWRLRGYGPAYEVVGGRCLYDVQDVQSWLAKLNEDNPHFKFHRAA